MEEFEADPNVPAGNPDWHINDHGFVRAQYGTWHVFAIVAPNPDSGDPTVVNYFGHASADSLTQKPWAEQSPPFYETLSPGSVVWAPHIVRLGDVYHMFYCGGGEADRFAIVLRTSRDLTAWSEPTVLFRDGFQALDPMVIRIPSGNAWVMYYTATERPDGGYHVVAYRTSEDLIHWSERGIAYADHHEGTAYGPTESPFVVRRGQWYYLFIGPRPYDPPSESLPNWMHPGYAGTDVFRSQRWDRWTNADYAGHVKAHAPEAVEDEKGAWFVSHAGIHQDGLYVAKMAWHDGIDAVEPTDPNPKGEWPSRFRLAPNFPNPFNATTRIRFETSLAATVRVAVYDLRGRRVRQFEEVARPAGLHETSWDGTDDKGVSLPSGMYVCEIRAGRRFDGIKMVLLR